MAYSESARVLQVATTIPRDIGREGLKPGTFIVEIEPRAKFRLTNDIQNQSFDLPEKHLDFLIDTENKTYSIFTDTSR